MNYGRVYWRSISAIIFMVLIFNLFPSVRVQALDEVSNAADVRILILNSYRNGDPWESEILNGIEAELNSRIRGIKYEVEYMDMRKYSSEEYLDKLYDLYKLKYSGSRYDLIIACDNDALNLLNKYHNNLFKNVPVIFTGVNNFKETMISDKEFFTGIVEENDIKSTIDIALKLHPGTQEIQVVTDLSTTGKAVRESVEEIIPLYSGNIKFKFIQSQSMNDIKASLSHANKKSIVLILGEFSSTQGDAIPIREGTKEISDYSKLPIYSCWDFLMDSGIIGGVMTDGKRQGQLAGQSALKVLEGMRPSQVAIVSDRSDKYTFDYKMMKRFNINHKMLPENSFIINKPHMLGFIERGLIWKIAIVLLLLILVGAGSLGYNVYTRRMTERALTKKSEHFKRRAEENRKLYTEAIEYDKLKTEFFANISHELRTPLNVLLSMLQLFEVYVENGDIAYNNVDIDKKISVMRQNCFRLLRLVNNLIDITKIDSGFFQLQLQNRDIVAVVEDITLSVADYIENKGIELIFDTDIEEKVLACDPDKIERIVLNLLSNSIKFTPRGGSIMINVADKGSCLSVSVRDSGIGIPEDKKALIFERFRQVDKSLSRNNEGSGIGLSLVKSLVEMHGGRIYVESEYGKGSVFTFEIPVKLIEHDMEETDKSMQIDHADRVIMEFADIYSYN